jgi:hypothetical protein
MPQVEVCFLRRQLVALWASISQPYTICPQPLTEARHGTGLLKQAHRSEVVKSALDSCYYLKRVNTRLDPFLDHFHCHFSTGFLPSCEWTP